MAQDLKIFGYASMIWVFSKAGKVSSNSTALYLYSLSNALSFIHSSHFYSTPSSPLLLRGAPDYSTDTVSEFHAEAHRQVQVKDLPQGPYMVARAGVESTTLWLKVIVSTKVPPCPTTWWRLIPFACKAQKCTHLDGANCSSTAEQLWVRDLLKVPTQ